MSTETKRLCAAFACYAALALLATATLQGSIRTMVWIFLGGLAAKTLIGLRLRS